MSKIANITIDKNPSLIPIQSMLKRPLSSYSREDFLYLYNLGCDIMRFSIASETEEEIREAVDKTREFFPLVSDIQGNLNQALKSIKAGCQGLRLNPANFKDRDLEEIIDLAKEKSICIRIGLNEGSLKDKSDKKILSLIEKYIKFFECHGFTNLVLSCKSSSISRSIELNFLLYNNFSYPLHVGLTEGGGEEFSCVKSSIVVERAIIARQAGTIRFSISGSEDSEIIAARSLLNTLEEIDDRLKCCIRGRFNLISCPMCSRAGIDTKAFSNQIIKFIFSRFDVRKMNLSLAVLGCGVNGIEEGKGADLGLYPIGGGKFKLFLKGEDYAVAEGLNELMGKIEEVMSRGEF